MVDFNERYSFFTITRFFGKVKNNIKMKKKMKAA